MASRRKDGRGHRQAIYGEAMTSSQRHQHVLMERSKVHWRTCAHPARRARLEADPEKWLKHYLAATFTRPFEMPHREIIAGAMHAHETGGRFAVAAERGIGKSTILWGLVLYLALSGRQRFPVCIPWADKAMKRAFRFWKMALCFNEHLLADYPEICAPFAHSRGIAQKVQTTTWDGGPNDNLLTGSQLTVGEGMIVFPDQRGCMGGSTINGNPRGLNHPQEDGSVLRPTIILLDDVQDRKTAKSPVQVDDTVQIIDGDVAGCGEAGKDLPMLMSGNCIMPEDVMEHYLESREWRSIRVPCVLKWPKGWGNEKSKCRKLWAEWYDRYLAGDAAPTFYRKNKRQMIDGMELSAPYAFRRSEGVRDAEYGVMRAYHTMGHDAFHAERQQKPERRSYSLYVLTPALVRSRADKTRQAGTVPDWSVKTIAATDVNPSYALTTAVVAFGSNQQAAVLWYGTYRKPPLPVHKNMTKAEQRKRIYSALANHGKEIAGLSCRPNLWVIDGLGSPAETVVDLAANAPAICGLEALCCFGRGWKTYRPTGKHKITVGEQLHLTVQAREKQWLVYNSDYWREIAQRGWTGEPGSPGSCSLPAGNHLDFSVQVCREQLAGKDDLGGRTVWVYDTAPGPHDYGDCMHMAYMGAAAVGIGTGGMRAPQQPRQSRWKKKRIKA